MDTAALQERTRRLLAATEGANTSAAVENLGVLAYLDQPDGVRFPDIAAVDGHECIVREAAKMGAALVILDNFSTLATVEDENKAGAFDPVIQLMRELKRRGIAVLLVHHARKSGDATREGSYRGSQKMSVTFESIIRLTHPQGAPSHDGVAFELTFEKFRGLRTQETEALRAHLPAAPADAPWTVDVMGDSRLRTLVNLVKSCRYPTQADLAARLEVAAGTLSGMKQEAIAQGLITLGEWKEKMKAAHELAVENETALSIAANDR
jgi:KaiC/GvpD/RAD55 family RecA-like ATPase